MEVPSRRRDKFKRAVRTCYETDTMRGIACAVGTLR